MRAQEVVKENEGADERVGVNIAIEAVFGIIPCFESFVKAFDEVVRDVGGEVFNIDVGSVREVFFDSDLVSVPVIGNDGARRAERLDGRQDGMSR